MLIFVLYVMIFALTALAAMLIAKIFDSKSAIDYSVGAFADDVSFEQLIRNLSAQRRSSQAYGAGLSIKRIKKLLTKGFRIVAVRARRGEKCYDFEQKFYESYFKIFSEVREIEKSLARFKKLPHYDNQPNIYSLCSVIVKASGGLVTEKRFYDGVKLYSRDVPLTSSEVMMLNTCLSYALIEYLAIFAAKISRQNVIKTVAKKDIKRGRINTEYMRYDIYAATVMNSNGLEFKHNYERHISGVGLDIGSRLNEFALKLSKYSSSVESAMRTLHEKSGWFSGVYTLSLSPIIEYFESAVPSFSNLADITKFSYLRALEAKAKKQGKSETELAAEVVRQSAQGDKDIAFFILPSKLSGRWNALFVIISLLLSAVAASAVGVFFGVLGIVSAALIFLPLTHFIYEFLLRVLTKYSKIYDYPEVKITDEKRQATAIICCRFIKTKDEYADAVRNILTVAAANRGYSYGLLLDAPEEIKRHIKENYDEKCGFFVAVRRENYERKRGAILQFNDLITENDKSAFDVLLGQINNYEYVITLDADSLLLGADYLVQALEHPYLRDKNIMSLPMRANPYKLKTPFSRLMSGCAGLDRYSRTADSGDILFGNANYTGKGIYRPHAFNKLLRHAFAPERILSHDLIEGAFAGASTAQISGLDEFPLSFSAYMSRQIRWLRGDVQLLPFIFPYYKNDYGYAAKSPLNFFYKWRIFLNAIAALFPIFKLAVLFIAPFSSLPWAFVLLALFPDIFGILLSLSAISNGIICTLKDIAVILLNLLVLPTFAIGAFAAFCVTIARLVRKKNLISWTTFAHYGGKGVKFIANYAAFIAFALLPLIPSVSLFFIIPSVLFLLAPLLLALIDKSYKQMKMSAPARNYFTSLSRATWNYFESFPDYVLPPDNEEGGIKWADRTSPTDIGMTIASTIAAHYIGIISYQDAKARVDKLLNVCDRLKKLDGLPYNWYRASDGALLAPHYVSSVDAGNLLVTLVLAREFYGGNALVEKLINQMDFSRLYDYDRKLLHIGYNDDQKRLDGGHYDLVGSEALLTYLTLIGFGKIPQDSYYALSTLVLRAAGNCLVSWTGGMFEYLMPLLFLQPPHSSMINVSAKNVIKTHRKSSKRTLEPVWGRSESLYAVKNDAGDYSYTAIGQSSIALSNAASRSVSAPYASVMSLAVTENYASEIMRMLSRYGNERGLPDAIDFENNKVVDSRMTHHQGMIMCALCAALGNDKLRGMLRNSSEIRAAELLLCYNADGLRHAKRKKVIPIQKVEEEITRHCPHALPSLSFLTNGKYSAVIDENGKGYSRCNGVLLTRFDEPAGIELYVSSSNAASQPNCITSQSECISEGGRVEYKKSHNGLISRVKAYVLQGLNGEVREVRITNSSKKPLKVKFSAEVQPCLQGRMGDIAHKAFSSLFVRTENRGNHCIAVRGDKSIALALSDTRAQYFGSKQFFTRGSGVNFGEVVFPKLYGAVEIELAPSETFYTAVILLSSPRIADYKSAISSAFSEGYLLSAEIKSAAVSRNYKILPPYKLLASQLLYKSSNISGQLPLVVLRAVSEEKLSNDISELKLLRHFGVLFDVTILYKENYGGTAKIADYVNRAVVNYGDGISAHNEIYAPAAVISDIKRRGINIYKLTSELLCMPQKPSAPLKKSAPMPAISLEYPLGLGGFTKDGYYANISKNSTPAPWCNIIANSTFGTVITSNGGGFTFESNSQQRKLTKWSGDEFNDVPGEAVVFCERGRLWSATRHPITRECDYAFEHKIGSSEFTCNYNGILAHQKIYIQNNVKHYDITLRDYSGKKRNLDILFYANLVLGDFVQNTRSNIEFFAKEGEIGARNGDLYASVGSSVRIKSHSFYTEAFLRDGQIYRARNLENVGASPCLAISGSISIDANQAVRVIYTLSAENAPKDAIAASAIENASYPDFVLTGDEKPYKYYLKWLFAQSYYSRFTARAGNQQVSGAYGFRDQLQDCLALIYAYPALVRSHIIKCCARQFISGDVMHWWHEPYTGVRTHICDDRLFLPYVVSEYIDLTGDADLLRESVPYLEDIAIPSGAHSVYAEMTVSKTLGTVYEHCMRAINSVELSDGDLVKMGGGDWNDGMDKVGIKGKGESVWCSMFLYFVAKKFASYAEGEDLSDLHALQNILRAAVNACYEKDRFTRAIMDDGTVLGSEKSPECKIDLLVQAWAVLSGIADLPKARTAMMTAYDKLVDRKAGIIKLLNPPLKEIDAGYIANYPKGVRENGGQYTHAAAWYIRAMYELGENERAEELLEMILPASHALSADGVERYRLEPYVIAADVYSGELSGQGGWSWYTGSAAWVYKTIFEYHYGIKLQRGAISFSPRMRGKANLVLSLNSGKIDVAIDKTKCSSACTVSVNGLSINASSYSIKSLIGSRVLITD